MDQIDKHPGNRMERKKEATHQKIIAVALQLIRQQGFDATTMEQIAAEADIARGTLYNYFPVKESILSAYVEQSFTVKNPQRVLHLQKLPDTRSRMRMILSDLMEGIKTQKEIFERYFSYRIQNMVSLHQDESVRSGFHQLETEIIAMGQKSGELRCDVPVDILIDLFEFVFIEVVRQFYAHPQDFNPNQVIEPCIDLFMNGAKKGF